VLLESVQIQLLAGVSLTFLVWERTVVNDTDARNIVRQLMERFDSIDIQHTSLTHVLAKKDPQEYTRLLETAEKIAPKIAEVLAIIDEARRRAYVALDDRNANWYEAVLAWLNEKGPTTLSTEQGFKAMDLTLSDELDT
jgi:hypothetical protein